MDKDAAEKLLRSWHLGQTSARYESSGRGAGTIAHVAGDHGGASYGEYQLSSSAGTLREYLTQSMYGPRFASLPIGSAPFDAAWRELARTDPGFAADQHQFIGRSHYADQLHRLQSHGLDLSHRGPAVQDCVWSTAVQMRHLTPRVFEKGLTEAYGPHVEVNALTDRQIVEAAQDYKVRHNAELFSKSPALWNGLRKRAGAEREDLVKLADAEAIAPHARSAGPAGRGHDATNPHSATTRASEHSRGHARDEILRQPQAELMHLGYTGADGRELRMDGLPGRNSRHALAQFQRDEGMQPTGRIDSASARQLHLADRSMASSTHPAHALYEQSLNAVWAAERQRGVAPGEHSIALAGVVTTEALRSGLARVDRVEIGTNGQFARGIQLSPGGDIALFNQTTATIDTRTAVQKTLLASSVEAADLHSRQAAVSQQHTAHSVPMRAPVL